MLPLFASAVTLGALLYTIIHPPVLFVLSVTAIGILAIYAGYRSKRLRVFSLIVGSCFVIGFISVQSHDITYPKKFFGKREINATVLSVDRRLLKTIIIVRDNDTKKKIQLTLADNNAVLPGDLVIVQATVEKPESFRTATERIFDYPRYLASKGIVGISTQVKIVRRDEGKFSISRFAALVRFGIAAIFSKYVSFPVDGIISGMTVGYQGGVSDTIQKIFRDTGVLHVLVLSGYNITLVVGFLTILLRGIPIRLRAIGVIAGILLLVVVSGAGVASVRAGIMGCLPLIGLFTGRKYRPITTLTIAYLFFFFLSPLTIFVDPGFHLSFLATSFMIVLFPKIEQRFDFLPKGKMVNIRELVLLAFMMPLFMLPYTMYFSGVVPLASPVANVVIAIVTPIFSIMAGLILCCSWIPLLAQLIGIILSSWGNSVIHVLELASALPLLNTPAIGWWVVVLCYVTVFSVLLRRELYRHFWQLQNYLQQPSNSSG